MFILKHVQEQDYFLVCLNKHLTNCMVDGKCYNLFLFRSECKSIKTNKIYHYEDFYSKCS